VPKLQAFNEFNNIFDKKINMKKILGAGNALVDIVTYIDDEKILEKFSLPKGSMQLVERNLSEKIRERTRNYKSTFSSGGSAANTIYGLAMLGIETGFIGSTGKDETGDFFENDLRSAGVKTFLKKCNEPTGTALALVTPDSERTFATYLGAAVNLDPEDLNINLFHGYDYLYLEGYLIYNLNFVLKACSLARSLNMKIAIDLASYNVVEENLSSFKNVIENYADIIFANAMEAKAFTGFGPEEALNVFSDICEIAVVKTGSEGSMAKRGNESVKIKAIPVECRDTTGAGDLYASGFLYGIARDETLEKCGQYGSYLAGKVIEITGARIEPAKWNEIKNDIDLM